MNQIIEILKSMGIDTEQVYSTLQAIDISENDKKNLLLPVLKLIKVQHTDYCSQLFLTYNSMLNNLKAGIAIASNDIIVFLNTSFSLYAGADIQINDSLQLLINSIHSQDRPVFVEYIEKVKSDIKFDQPLNIRAISNERIKWIEVCANKIIYNNMPALQFMFEDVSERMQNNSQKEFIEKMVIETEKQRSGADKMIEQSAKITSVGMITTGITHEINQPLNAIKLGADGLLMWNIQNPNVFPEKILKIINNIALSASKMDEIIKHLRSFWNEDSAHCVPISLNNTINRAIELMGQKLKSHDVKLELVLDSKIEQVIAEPAELELILNNLIINSINHFDKDSYRHDKYIKIETLVDASKIILRYSDNGTDISGIPENMSYDSSVYNNHRTENFGAELAVVKLFVTNQKAEIKAYSNANGGADFTIKFRKYINNNK